jgi:rSAM/selenodomain-associated transferase 2
VNRKPTSPSTTPSNPSAESPQTITVSIIIPTLNEGDLIAEAIEKAWQTTADEVILSDGGSTDQTIAVAQGLNCKIVKTSPGRGQQLNAGAAVATGDILLFLHVDNWLDTSAADQIRAALHDNVCVGGGFKQRIDSEKFAFRMVEFGNYVRAKKQRLVYGDQALFVRRSVFQSLGGFPEIPLMEDFVFSQTLFQGQRRPVMLPGPLHVNPRRWEKTGVLRQTFRNWRTAAAFRLGASPESLYQRYYQD